MGGCERSALIHWLELPEDIQASVMPEYIVAFADYTNTTLEQKSLEMAFRLENVGPYIPERGGIHRDRVYKVVREMT